MTEDVARFNARLRAGGIREQFPASPIPAWLPKIPGRRLYQEYFLAADNGSNVRGAYILKHQDFQIGGQVVPIADFHLPISEGAVDRAYVQVGVQLLLDARQRQPLLYALGMGGYDEPLPRLLKACRWEMFSVPFFLRVVRPAAFLRNIAHLRQTPLRRGLLDFLACTGLGYRRDQGMEPVAFPPRRTRGPASPRKSSIISPNGPTISGTPARRTTPCRPCATPPRCKSSIPAANPDSSV